MDTDSVMCLSFGPYFWFLDFRKEMSAYYLEHADVSHIQKHFDNFEEEARSLLSLGLPIPAYAWMFLYRLFWITSN